jgi:hypothetical protein
MSKRGATSCILPLRSCRKNPGPTFPSTLIRVTAGPRRFADKPGSLARPVPIQPEKPLSLNGFGRRITYERHGRRRTAQRLGSGDQQPDQLIVSVGAAHSLASHPDGKFAMRALP